MVAPVLVAVFEAKNESRFRRWLGECCIGGEKLVSNTIYCWGEGLHSRHFAHIQKKKKPSPVWAMSTAEQRRGLIFGRIWHLFITNCECFLHL